MLSYRVHQLRATTHRGEYDVMRSDPFTDRWASYFHQWGGGCRQLKAGPLTAVCDANNEHVQTQPVHPPMLGWPAQTGEVMS